MNDVTAIRARFLAWYNDTPDEATWPGRDEDESMERYIVRQHVRDLLDAVEGGFAAPTAGVDREALREAVAGTLALAYGDDPDMAFVSDHDEATADAVLGLLADQIPAPVDADAVERAVGGVLFNAMNFPPRVQALMLGQDVGPLRRKVVDAVLAALAAARAGGVTVTAEQVERLARDKADAIAVAQGALPYGDTSWAHVRHEYIGPIRADLTALGIEVQR